MDALRFAVTVAVGAIITRVFSSRRLHQERHDDRIGYTPVKIADQVLNGILSMLPDAVAIAIHANRRTAMRGYGGFVFVYCNPTPRVHYARLRYDPYEHTYSCLWVTSNGTYDRGFNHKGRFTQTGHWEPFTHKVRHCGRFTLQRMCRRLVQRTRRRIQCRIHLQPYLIPDLVNIVTAYC